MNLVKRVVGRKEGGTFFMGGGLFLQPPGGLWRWQVPEKCSLVGIHCK